MISSFCCMKLLAAGVLAGRCGSLKDSLTRRRRKESQVMRGEAGTGSFHWRFCREYSCFHFK